MIKVAIYEDNNTLRDSLTHLVKSCEDFLFVGAFANATELLSNCRKNCPDVILMDIDMPQLTGIEATEQLKTHFPNVNVLILTVYEDKDKIFSALQAGASGYLLKKSKVIDIIESIHEIHTGGAPMTPAIARKVLDFFSRPKMPTDAENALSERELDILKCLVDGDSYKMIGEKCFISMGTVRSHITNIYKKLHVNSKSEAVVKAIQHKLV